MKEKKKFLKQNMPNTINMLDWIMKWHSIQNQYDTSYSGLQFAKQRLFITVWK